MEMNMNYKEFVKQLKMDETHQIYLLYGREQYLVHWAEEALKEKYITKAFESLNYNSINSGQIDAAANIINICETLPVMSEKRMVVLNDFSLLEGTKIKGFSDEDEKKLAKYLEHLPESCILVMTCGSKVDKRKSLYKKAAKMKSVYEFTLLDTATLKKWIMKRFRNAKKTINNKCLIQFIEASGYYDKESEYTLYNFENDIKKMICYAGNEKEIKSEDIDQIISGNIEKNVFDLIDAISTNKKAKAVKILNQALLYGEAEYKILALLNRQLENLLHIKVLKESGMDISVMKEKLLLPDFVIKKLLKMSSRFTLDHLKSINIRVYESDKNIKTGIMDAKLALEMLLAQV